MPALRGRMGRCQPYVVWASHVEAKPIPHRNMKRSPHDVGPNEGLASADREVRGLKGSPGLDFTKAPCLLVADGSCRRRQMLALRGRMGSCRPYVVWAAHAEAKPIPQRNMKRSLHHVGPASAHSAQGLASADRSEGSGWGASPGGIFM